MGEKSGKGDAPHFRGAPAGFKFSVHGCKTALPRAARKDRPGRRDGPCVVPFHGGCIQAQRLVVEAGVGLRGILLSGAVVPAQQINHAVPGNRGGTRKAVIYGLVTATCFSVTFAITGRFIVHIFTNDIQMIELVVKLLVVDIFLEFGRVTNLVYGQALKTSGDAIFPVIMGAIFMYLFAVGGTYFLGIHMGLLAVGAYIAMAGDECARAVGMVLRWKSGKWKSKSLVE